MGETPTFVATDFQQLSKVQNVAFGKFCKAHKIKIDPALETDPAGSVAKGLFALYSAKAFASFFQVFTHALPVREAVWLACLAGERLLPEEGELTDALKAAQAWVYRPNLETRADVEKVILEADQDDPTVLAADAAFHGIAKGLEDAVMSPPNACPLMVFALLIKAALIDDDVELAEKNWQELVGLCLNIGSGGNGKSED